MAKVTGDTARAELARIARRRARTSRDWAALLADLEADKPVRLTRALLGRVLLAVGELNSAERHELVGHGEHERAPAVLNADGTWELT